MDGRKEAIRLDFKIWLNKMEKEHHLSEDELAVMVSDFTADIMYLKQH